MLILQKLLQNNATKNRQSYIHLYKYINRIIIDVERR